MKVLFTAAKRTDTLGFYVSMLEGLGALPGVSIRFFEEDYENYDVVLLMGVDPDVAGVRRRNPAGRVGVVDPRRAEGSTIEGDFLIAQGLEQENAFSDYYLDVYRYEFHPPGVCDARTHAQRSPLVIGYHGNKVHLHTMYPALTSALEALAEERAVELRAYYDAASLGPVDARLLPRGVRFEARQWRWDVFDREFGEIDIGVVPNAIPIGREDRVRRAGRTAPALFNEADTDYVVRYKNTSNIARLYPFARRGVPVVADLYPSACHFIEHGVDAMIGGSAGMWYRSLRALADSAERRTEIAGRMLEKYRRRASPEAMNAGLAAFLRELLERPARRAPASLAASPRRLVEPALAGAEKAERRLQKRLFRERRSRGEPVNADPSPGGATES